MTGETRVTIRGPLGVTSKLYSTLDDAIEDRETWQAEYERQWRAMPWWCRAWSHVWWWLFGPGVER